MLSALVVEDDRESYEICRMALNQLGVERIEYAGSSEQAGIFLMAGGFDLMLLDIGLPGKSGLEFASCVRWNPETRLTEILFITGSSKDYELEAYRKIHCYEYIRKPFTCEELRRKLDLLIGGIREKKRIEQEACEKNLRRSAIICGQGGSTYQFELEQLLYIESRKGKVYAHCGRVERLLADVTLRDAFLQLSEICGDFDYCHRLFLVNTQKIQEIRKESSRKYLIWLTGAEEPLELSSRYLKQIQSKMKGGLR